MQLLGAVIKEISAWLDALNVFCHALRIHTHHQINAFTSAEIAFFAHTDFIPSGQTLNIRWKNVFRSDRNTHSKNGFSKQKIRTCRTRTIDIRKSNDKIINFIYTQHEVPAFETLYIYFCISQAAVGHLSAHKPQ